MVSNAREDLPEPLKPVMTTSLSRGMFSVRFLRLCSRAPPMRMNSLLMAANFPFKSTGKDIQNSTESKAGCRTAAILFFKHHQHPASMVKGCKRIVKDGKRFHEQMEGFTDDELF